MAKVAKMKFFRDFDKEEAWLNRMAADGLLLTKAGLRYQFEPVAPGSAVVRVDYQPSMPQSDFDDYVTLFADSGWHHLDGSRLGGPQYFASTSTNANTEIFSDEASKAQRYRRSLIAHGGVLLMRSEERRVGKECRFGGCAYQQPRKKRDIYYFC